MSNNVLESGFCTRHLYIYSCIPSACRGVCVMCTFLGRGSSEDLVLIVNSMARACLSDPSPVQPQRGGKEERKEGEKKKRERHLGEEKNWSIAMNSTQREMVAPPIILISSFSSMRIECSVCSHTYNYHDCHTVRLVADFER